MAQLTRPVGRPAVRSPVSCAMADMALHVWTRYWTRRAEHATIGILHALDDRTLKDIGLDRSEIESAVCSTRRDERRMSWAPRAECGVSECC
jgi:uncharacterized protein YjiS (DUF1127 family)